MIVHFYNNRCPEIFGNEDKSLETWINLFKHYNEKELNITNEELYANLDLDSLQFDPNTQEAVKIAKLILAAAVKGNKKQEFIQGIIMLDKTTQMHLMNIIQTELISGEKPSSSGSGEKNNSTPNQSKTTVPTLEKEKDYSTQMNELDKELMEIQIQEKYERQIESLKDDKRRSQLTLETLSKQIKQRDVAILSYKEEIEKLEQKSFQLLDALKTEEERTRKMEEQIKQQQSFSSFSSSNFNQSGSMNTSIFFFQKNEHQIYQIL